MEAKFAVLVMENAGLVALARPEDVAVSVYPLPGWSRLRFPKVAWPLAAGVVVVPERVAPPGFAARATLMALVAVPTTFPRESWIATNTAGLMGVPTVVLSGDTAKARRVAAPPVMLNRELVAVGSPV